MSSSDRQTLRGLQKRRKVIGRFIVKKAPEPSDLIWFNFVREFDGRQWFWASLASVVGVNAAFIFIFKYIKKLQHAYLDDNEEINWFFYGRLWFTGGFY